MRKEKHIFYPNLSPFIEVVPFSFLCFSCLLSKYCYFMSFLCIAGFPHSFELFLVHGTPKQGQNLLPLLMHQQCKDMNHRKALSSGNNPKCPKPLVLPAPTHDTEHLSQGPSVQMPFPLPPYDMAWGFPLVERKTSKSVNTNARLTLFLKAGRGLHLVLPEWLKNCHPAAPSVSWVCPESRWVFPGVSYHRITEC